MIIHERRPISIPVDEPSQAQNPAQVEDDLEIWLAEHPDPQEDQEDCDIFADLPDFEILL